VKGLGFSLIEVLSPCPTIWKQSPVQAQHWVKEVMEKTYPLGVFCDRTQTKTPLASPPPAPSLVEIPHILGVAEADLPEGNAAALSTSLDVDLHIRVAGFGGQGVLLLGEMLAEAGLDAGLEVSWLPSYGPEIRSGTSNCHVRISREPIDSPMVAEPNLLVAMNEPSLRKFIAHVRPGGWVFYNGVEMPADCDRADLHTMVYPFMDAALELGDQRVGNMVMLGAVLECAQALPQASVTDALRRLVKHAKWIDLDTRAIQLGAKAFRKHAETLVEAVV
jgi:2-oxoisovalerate ferredoxin oxidoreductase beta subunit